jgi:hypothetical protein
VTSAAAARFWCNLQDVASGCPSPPASWGPLSSDHPFLCCRGAALCVVVPPDAPFPR